MIMSKNLNESPVIRRNEEYIERLEKRLKKLRNRRNSYRMDWSSDEVIYRHRTTNRRMSAEKYDQLSREYYDLHQKLSQIKFRENEKVASKIVPFVTAYIVMDKKRNPDLYPDWLSLKIEDKVYGHRIKIQPYIDLEKLLKEKGSTKIINNIFGRIGTFLNRFFSDAAIIERLPKIYLGIDDYIKNVFRKEIRPRIMDEVEKSDCIHSIVFRTRDDGVGDIQIYPRIKSSLGDNGYNCKYSTYQIQRDLRKILEEYGWVRYDNYSDDTSRD